MHEMKEKVSPNHLYCFSHEARISKRKDTYHLYVFFFFFLDKYLSWFIVIFYLFYFIISGGGVTPFG